VSTRKAIGEYALLVARVAVGALFLAAGALKIGHADSFAATIAAFRLLPAPVIGPMALFVPFFEAGLGSYLVLGLFTRAAAYAAAAELVLFGAAVATVVARGLPVACGCFGPGDSAPATWFDVVRDLGLAGVAVIVAVLGPGKLALDERIGAISSNGSA
jgi:uncharacterized membrane protein YphA (DoxX/SURF4 family)